MPFSVATSFSAKEAYFTGGRRASAIFIDTVLVSIAAGVLLQSGLLESLGSVVGLALQYVVLFCDFTIFSLVAGASPGKLVMKLRVRKYQSADRPSPAKVVLRTALSSVAYLSFLQYPLPLAAHIADVPVMPYTGAAERVLDVAFYWLIINLLFVIFEKSGRAAYDFTAETVVVDVRRPV